MTMTELIVPGLLLSTNTPKTATVGELWCAYQTYDNQHPEHLSSGPDAYEHHFNLSELLRDIPSQSVIWDVCAGSGQTAFHLSSNGYTTYRWLAFNAHDPTPHLRPEIPLIIAKAEEMAEYLSMSDLLKPQVILVHNGLHYYAHTELAGYEAMRGMTARVLHSLLQCLDVDGKLAIYDTHATNMRDPTRFVANADGINQGKQDWLSFQNGEMILDNFRQRSRKRRVEFGQIRQDEDTYGLYNQTTMQLPMSVEFRVKGSAGYPFKPGGMYIEIIRLADGEQSTTNMDELGYEIHR